MYLDMLANIANMESMFMSNMKHTILTYTGSVFLSFLHITWCTKPNFDFPDLILVVFNYFMHAKG